MTPFHLAFPVRDLEETRTFYGEVLGCAIGRSSTTWVDFDLFGHQMSAHLRPRAAQAPSDGKVDGMTMRAISPATDFSFDFQDLDFKRVDDAK